MADTGAPADKTVELSGGEDALPVVRTHNVWLIILTIMVGLYILKWAAPILIPIVVGVLISYALSPPVTFLQKWHVPRALGAAVLLMGLLGGAAGLTYSLGDEATEIIERLPEAVQKMRYMLRAEQGSGAKTVEKVQTAATEIENATNDNETARRNTPRGVTRVQIEKPRVNIQDYLWSGTVGLATVLGQLFTVMFFAFFLLVAGDSFRRKLVALSGPRLSEKRLTLEVLNDITHQIQRYLMVQAFTSVLVGVASWLAFSAVGLENAAVWGIVAGVLNSVPYFGPVVVSGGVAIIALLQFGTIGMALGVSGIALAITSIEGFLLTPWLIGRAGRINGVVVFGSVILGGWLWGPWGLLLGVPVVMVIKAVCDHVEEFKPVAELLGE